MTNSAPLIIGAIGGSGTRVVARLARHAGYDLGAHLNSAEDALEFQSFHDKWINRFLKAELRRRPLRQDEVERMKEDFQQSVSRHLSGSAIEDVSRIRWGWKAPRSIYLLPFLHQQFPGLRFMHVLRDGRDMALSKNQNQVRKHGAAVLSWRERIFCSLPERSLRLWERVNLRAANYGETRLNENYHVVRFEDLCRAPVEATAGIMSFLNVGVDAAASVAQLEIVAPTSIGRWREQPAWLVARLERSGKIALGKFGYLN